MIRLGKYFFQPEDVDKEIVELGNTERSFNGTLHSGKVAEYTTITLNISHLSPAEHSHLLYILDKSRDLEEDESLTFTDDLGEEYDVIIPVDGFNYEREKGEEETYRWELQLEEVI